jgi:LmbE family N-acetylglucosaminyl deacetylase
MPAPRRQVALAFLAHPDDAEILCAGTLIRLRNAGWEVHIATATAGDCGSMTLPPARISAIRLGEARRAARLIGATYHCLREKDVLVTFDKASIRKAIDLFRVVAPSLVFTHPPADYMMDHEQVHLLARAASFAYGAPNASRRPLREGSTIPYLYYCDPIEGIDPLGRGVRPTTVIEIAGQQAKKLEMLACHASQRAWLQAHHGMDKYLDAVRRHDAVRGRLIRSSAAEAFVQHRGHAYPSDDLLSSLFAKPSRPARRRRK